MPVAPPTARSVTADGPPASSSRVAEARIRSFVDAIVGPARRNAALSRPVGRCRPVPKLSSGEVLLASQSHYSKIRAVDAIRPEGLGWRNTAQKTRPPGPLSLPIRQRL